jgi:hypothetical protein
MYGFGDDRNPANDAVNVMEEILIEYITDVVRFERLSMYLYMNLMNVSARRLRLLLERQDWLSKTCEKPFRALRMLRSWREWKSCSLCRRISNEPVPSSKIRNSIILANFNVHDLYPS